MEKYEIQKLRDLPIEGVAEQLGMVVKRHKALCPFHDDHHASLVQYEEEQLPMLCVHGGFRGHHRPGDEIPGEGFPLGLPMAGGGEWVLSGRFASEGGFFLFTHLPILFLFGNIFGNIFGRFFRNFFEGISEGITILLLRCREVCEIL